MALRKRHLITPPPQTHLLSSPALSAVRSSPLSSGTILTPSVSVSPFTSLPVLSPVGRESSVSPDYFEDFAYSSDMDNNLRRIDREFSGVFPDGDGNSVGGQVLTMSAHESKTWVVFRGKTPSIYDNGLSAAMQIQGYRNAFQRAFSDLDAATQAWNTYVRDKIHPDYGKAPWVVFLGRRPGVFTRVSELEACVRGYENAIFRSCSSVAEGKIKFQLFAEQVNQIPSVPDPFAGVEALMPQRAEEIRETALSQKSSATVQSIAPVPTAPVHPLSSPLSAC
ncbi:hypothetical protein BJ322DRAFT_1114794 [Thelephora terrestris]|uniref:Ribonuclease H1 N-terminal domain-containing protein n=1 Tax=Thelephora terrestris TaxID=56493 RepID=A0A9P6L0C1_9AGAM|nr:hypothetical protein BJ322DRAFT_1114794 [Thelephora terrestris]